MPYLLEAVEMVSEGIPKEMIDRAALNFGMPMGPIELADTVGLDVCLAVAKTLSETMNVEVPRKLTLALDNNKLGKKSGEGFYKWSKGKPVKDKNASYANLPEVEDRLIMRMLNEAVACLREKVVDSEELIDAGVIFGTGFAPFRGGPLHHVRAEGVDGMSKRMTELKSRYGDRFTLDEGWTGL
jgi:3-hydroxyacyl-CoA dehydrogenase/enoyl-CoA hydratase/3-hydroxybutyryl-CoA epimerase